MRVPFHSGQKLPAVMHTFELFSRICRYSGTGVRDSQIRFKKLATYPVTAVSVISEESVVRFTQHFAGKVCLDCGRC
jgi:hypothetical protein